MEVEKILVLDVEVVKNENWVFGAAVARRRMMVRSGAAWVPKGKAKTAMWGSLLLEEEEECMVDYGLIKLILVASCTDFLYWDIGSMLCLTQFIKEAKLFFWSLNLKPKFQFDS